jgi:RNA-directed DNA polymerase
LQTLWQQAMGMGGCWLVEVDIRQSFDTLDRAHLRSFLRQRVRDGVVLRLIDKWLQAGVLQEGVLCHPEAGTPQGGVISPLLANVYLHYVLDVWFAQVVKPCLKGRAFLVRYADDFVMGFAWADDARRVLDVLPKRFGKYGLTIHPEKPRLVSFTRPAADAGATGSHGVPPPGSFDFLGFTHFWGRSQQGNWVVKRKTADGRFRRAVTTIAAWCRSNRHLPIREQHEALTRKLRGHSQYYGVIGNLASLRRFHYAVVCLWRKWRSRRRRRGPWAWSWFLGLLRVFVLPWPRAAPVPRP